MADRADALTPRPPATPAGGLAFPAALAALSALQAAYLAWYLVVPLPNASAAMPATPPGSGEPLAMRRWYILAEFVPYFLPGRGWGGSGLGIALANLSGSANLSERLPIALAGALIAAASAGLGLLALRALGLARVVGPAGRLPLAYLLGATGLGALTLALGRLGLVAPWPARIGLGVLALAGLAVEVHAVRRPRSPVVARPSSVRLRPALALGLALLPFLALMALASMLPTFDFDAVEYHLQGPKEWFLAGRVGFLPHNVYTTMPFGAEMLYLLGMHILGDWWSGALAGQFASMLFAPAAGLLVAGTAARLGSPTAGAFAALAYLTTPWVYRLAAIPYVEGPLVAYHAGLVYVAALAWRGPDPDGPRPSAPRLAALAGALAGGAMAIKYPGLISAVIPAGLMVLAGAARRRSAAALPAFAVGLALAAGPWLAKNLIDHGNPVYPLGNGVLGGSPWSPEREAKWAAAHGPRPLRLDLLRDDLTQVAGRNDWQSPLFALLAPLALLRPGSRRAALALGGFAAYVFATWWLLTHRIDRFWLPMLPALAVLAGLGADWTGRRAWRLARAPVVGSGLLACLAFNATDLAALTTWTEPYERLRPAVAAMASPPLAWVDEALPPDAKVLLVGQAAVFHARRAVLYNTVFDDDGFEAIARDRAPEQVARALRERGVTHVLVDWSEIARYRSPGNYGFTDFVRPEVFARLVEAGVLAPLRGPGPNQQVYRVL